MYEEFCAMQRRGTWSVVQFSPSKHIVGCKWVFKIKHNTDGSIARYKARLVAKGFHQEQGIDYNETFSPVVKHSTIRVILALAVQFHWSLHQLDATNAFLHGILKEDIYMTQPQGFTDPSFPNHVCKLHKSIYGLKQAPRAWYERFSSFLIGLGFHTSFPDASLFVRFHKGSIAIILLCVDDLVLTGNDKQYINSLLTQLSPVFETKYLGHPHHFLGIEVNHTTNGLFLSRTKYTKDLLLHASMLDAKPVASPCNYKSSSASVPSTPLEQPTIYRSIAGALQYQ